MIAKETVRRMLQQGVRGNSAHPDPLAIFDGVTWEMAGRTTTIYAHTIWQIAHHMHYWAQLKIILFQGGAVVLPSDDHFPSDPAPATPEIWEAFIHKYQDNLRTMETLLEVIELERRYPIWNDLTAAEMVMMMINHNSYHTAQIVAMRRALGIWKV